MSQTCLRYLPVITRNDALLASAEYLSLALADDPGDHEAWARSLAEAFGHVELKLLAHRKEARAPHGSLSAVDDTRPVGPTATRLREQGPRGPSQFPSWKRGWSRIHGVRKTSSGGRATAGTCDRPWEPTSRVTIGRSSSWLVSKQREPRQP